MNPRTVRNHVCPHSACSDKFTYRLGNTKVIGDVLERQHRH